MCIIVICLSSASPQDTAELWNTDHEQGEQLFARMLKAGCASGNGMLAGAALSGVSCEAAKRNSLQGKRSKAAGSDSAAAAVPAAAPKAKLKVKQQLPVQGVVNACSKRLQACESAKDGMC